MIMDFMPLSGNHWTRGLDAWARDWIGWSRPPIESEPILVDSVVDWCQRCGAGTRGALSGDSCWRCSGRPGMLGGVVRLGSYQGRLRELVGGLKYQGWWEAAGPLGRLLAHRLRDGVLNSGGAGINPSRTLVVPMPMPRARRFFRGIDHAGLLASAVASELGCPCRGMLSSSGGRTQVGVGRTERMRDRSRGSGSVKKSRFIGLGTDLNGVSIVLVDDVLTTGRTARHAGRSLEQFGPSRILLAVLAVSEQVSTDPDQVVKKPYLPLQTTLTATGK